MAEMSGLLPTPPADESAQLDVLKATRRDPPFAE